MEAALTYLARSQSANGSWDPGMTDGGLDSEHSIMVTGLSLLAYLGAGHTEKVGKYKGAVRRGVQFLIQAQKVNGAIGKGTGLAHAIAGLALAESYGMAKVHATGVAAQRAVDYSTGIHQREYDGWGRLRRSTPSLSISTWFVLQLKGAKTAGLRVPGAAWQGAASFLDRTQVRTENGKQVFADRPGRPWSTQATALGITSRLLMGHPPEEVQEGADALLGNLPKAENPEYSYWYFGTISMFQMGSEHWTLWNKQLRDMLVRSQKKGGSSDGTWSATGPGSEPLGRNGVTALAAMTLEVYYRYLPMYSRNSSWQQTSPAVRFVAPQVLPESMENDRITVPAEDLPETGKDAVRQSEDIRRLRESDIVGP